MRSIGVAVSLRPPEFQTGVGNTEMAPSISMPPEDISYSDCP